MHIRRYTSAYAAEDLNRTLRTKGTLRGDDKDTHEHLQAVFAKTPPLAKPVDTFRRIKISDPDKLQAHIDAARQSIQQGKPLVHQGYVSTSTSPDGTLPGNVEYRIRATHGVDVSPYAGKNMQNEKELLLNHGSRLQVRNVKQEGNRWVIEADQVHHQSTQESRTNPVSKHLYQLLGH